MNFINSKKAKATGFFSIVFLLILLGVSAYLLYTNLPVDPIELKIKNGIKNEEPPAQANYEDSNQFYENMRFPDKRINYRIEPLCDADKISEIEEAFSILESRTVLEFYKSESGGEPEIRIFCSEVEPEPDEEGYFVAGEGGPTKVINTSIYSVILEGKVSFFREEKCDDPIVAIHEILHVLGFDHNNNPKSVLYPTLDCEQTLDDSIVADINLLYSVKSAADLKIEELEASKAGKYPNFEIVVVNQGLLDAKNVMLGVYTEEELVQEFNLESIDVGTKKILTVENINVGRSATKIIFVIDEINRIDEIFEDNNEVEVLLEEA